MDPLRIIMQQLGNQFIILRVFGETYITEGTLNRSINFLIRTRIFENYSELAKC